MMYSWKQIIIYFLGMHIVRVGLSKWVITQARWLTDLVQKQNEQHFFVSDSLTMGANKTQFRCLGIFEIYGESCYQIVRLCPLNNNEDKTKSDRTQKVVPNPLQLKQRFLDTVPSIMNCRVLLCKSRQFIMVGNVMLTLKYFWEGK